MLQRGGRYDSVAGEQAQGAVPASFPYPPKSRSLGHVDGRPPWHIHECDVGKEQRLRKLWRQYRAGQCDRRGAPTASSATTAADRATTPDDTPPRKAPPRKALRAGTRASTLRLAL